MQEPLLQVQLLPAERHQFTHPEAMAVRQQDQRGVPVNVPAKAQRLSWCERPSDYLYCSRLFTSIVNLFTFCRDREVIHR